MYGGLICKEVFGSLMVLHNIHDLSILNSFDGINILLKAMRLIGLKAVQVFVSHVFLHLL